MFNSSTPIFAHLNLHDGIELRTFGTPTGIAKWNNTTKFKIQKRRKKGNGQSNIESEEDVDRERQIER